KNLLAMLLTPASLPPHVRGGIRHLIQLEVFMSVKRDSRAHRMEQLENRRLLSGGALDTSFSMDGLATATQSGFAFSANDAAVRSDGKIIVAGTATMKNHSYFFVARYNAGGSLDKTFGAAKTGIVTQDVAV